MNRSLWRSLRTRIVLLAVVTCIFLGVAVGSLYSFIRSTHRTTVLEAEKHLALVASELATVYNKQAEHGLSLRTITLPPGPPPLPPPPHEGHKHGPPPPPPLRPEDPLSRVTSGVLQNEEGIEGGFLAGAGPLVGYAFPTHEGPGSQKEMPGRERPTIDDIAHKAESTGAPQSFVFEGPHDVVIFAAQPVREKVSGAEQITGAAWLMQRLPEVNRGRSKQLLFASLGFGLAALVTALLAWFVSAEVSGGVAAVTRRLSDLEKNLTPAAARAEKPQLAEFERLLFGIDAMAAVLQDKITKERNLEDQLRHKERLSSLGQFAAGVAHELRNPLATIRLRAQMSEHATAEGIVARNSSVILEEVDRLDAMIGRLLLFARPISLDLQTIPVAELCRSVVAAWQERAPLSIRFRCEAPEELVLVADRSRLVQVLDNLIENAVQASAGQPGEVCLQASQQEHTVQIDVMDRGSGFTLEALKQAFTPFFTTRDTGTGLGLSIAFELVEAHGGELKAAPRPGGGAVVSLCLPNRPGAPQ